MFLAAAGRLFERKEREIVFEWKKKKGELCLTAQSQSACIIITSISCPAASFVLLSTFVVEKDRNLMGEKMSQVLLPDTCFTGCGERKEIHKLMTHTN